MASIALYLYIYFLRFSCHIIIHTYKLKITNTIWLKRFHIKNGLDFEHFHQQGSINFFQQFGFVHLWLIFTFYFFCLNLSNSVHRVIELFFLFISVTTIIHPLSDMYAFAMIWRVVLFYTFMQLTNPPASAEVCVCVCVWVCRCIMFVGFVRPSSSPQVGFYTRVK